MILNPHRFGTAGVAGDPSFANVYGLWHGDGADLSTVFTDSSSHLWADTKLGSPVVSTTFSKFGGASIRFPGGAQVILAPSTNWSWMHQLNGKWTWELFASFDSFAAERTLFSTSNGSTGDAGIYCGITPSRQIDFQMYRSINSTFVINNASGIVIPNDTAFHHIAIVCDLSLATGNLLEFVDGTLVATFNKTADAPTSNPATSSLKIGGYSTVGSYVGYMDEIRITKDVARYTAAFVPPTAAFPNSA